MKMNLPKLLAFKQSAASTTDNLATKSARITLDTDHPRFRIIVTEDGVHPGVP